MPIDTLNDVALNTVIVSALPSATLPYFKASISGNFIVHAYSSLIDSAFLESYTEGTRYKFSAFVMFDPLTVKSQL